MYQLTGRYIIRTVSLEIYGSLYYAGFDDQLMKLMVVQRSSLGVTVEEDVVQKQQQNVKMLSSISEILSMVCA